MRMWMVDPRTMCRQHLLGEHKELHMLAGTLAAGRRLGRFLTDGLVDVSLAAARHEALAVEMTARGYSHRSPLRGFEHGPANPEFDPAAHEVELRKRCVACAALKEAKE
jgi:hypothetical protein